jgi:tetrapyrrole methylase family protein/MazG family protein
MKDKEFSAIQYEATFEGLAQIVSILRSPGGCPWDRQQTPETLRSSLVEEVFECIDAVEKNDAAHVKEELGDILLLVTMLTMIYEEKNDFTFADVFRTINDKLLRRHPHVFGDANVDDAADVVRQWETIKKEVEGRDQGESILDGVPRNIPPLERSYHLQKKAAKTGFDWEKASQVMEKLQEEIGELQALLDAPEAPQEALEEELGDILFSVVNLSRFLKLDPTLALNRTNKKFINRFGYLERELRNAGKDLNNEPLSEMDRLWDQAKEKENR